MLFDQSRLTTYSPDFSSLPLLVTAPSLPTSHDKCLPRLTTRNRPIHPSPTSRGIMETPEPREPTTTTHEFEDYDGRPTTFTSLFFPGYGRVEITFENSPDRQAFGFAPAPVFHFRGEEFPPNLVLIKDELGNTYELLQRRPRLSPAEVVKRWQEDADRHGIDTD
jgi:hypothetical protein